MDISRDEAARALSDIAQTEGRSYALQGYRVAGPILIVWGIIWLICYTVMGLFPQEDWGFAWIPADIVGIIASIVIGRRGKRQGRGGDASNMGWRISGFAVLICLFCSAVFALFHPTDTNAYIAFPGILAGTIYTSIGLWRATRFLWVGMAVFAFSLIGFFFFPAYLAFWMAVTGGGGLIVGGLLVRRA